jgi:hypothetical protein
LGTRLRSGGVIIAEVADKKTAKPNPQKIFFLFIVNGIMLLEMSNIKCAACHFGEL